MVRSFTAANQFAASHDWLTHSTASAPPSHTGQGWDTNLLRDAQVHLERARAIDPSNLVAETFLSQVNLRYRHAPTLTLRQFADVRSDIVTRRDTIRKRSQSSRFG